jgi:dimethylargininase
MFTRAIVRPPGANFAAGLTTVDLGTPDYDRALAQHDRYCQALQECGLTLTRLPPDLRYPDSTFVEDVAILTERGAILTRPGAPSRAGEVAAIVDVLARSYPSLQAIVAPGTLDGGDICEAGDHFFIGVSQRTNEQGAQQLAGLLGQAGYTSSLVDVRAVPGILHLKSGLTSLGDGRLLVIAALAGHPALRGYELIQVMPGEEYAANCVRVNDHVLFAAGFPLLEKTISRLGYAVKTLAMSEFQKMDGGLSCLSLRF